MPGSSTPWLPNGSNGSYLEPGGLLGSFIEWGFGLNGYNGLFVPLPLNISLSGPIYSPPLNGIVKGPWFCPGLTNGIGKLGCW